MKEYLTILFLALTCEAMVNILGPLGFLVFAMTALILNCIAKNKKKKGGSEMPSIYVKQICAQLASNATTEIVNYLDCDLLFEGAAGAIPPELLLLEVVKFQKQNNKDLLYVR